MDYSEMPFVVLVDVCLEKGVKVTPKDTAETLRKKLSPKMAKPSEPKK